jgi:hypothetical protein
MALAALNWRYCGLRTFTAGNLPASHDAIYDMGTSATYADGSARVPGTGSAWTWNREQATGTTVAIRGTPPINALNFQYLIANTTGLTAYTFVSPDTATAANTPIYGMNRNSGAYTTWTSATPFTNAGFSGYWRAARAFGTVPYDSVSMWESQECIVVQYGHSPTGSTAVVGMGAFVDPLSTAALNAETDGRLYMMWATGSNTNTSAAWLGTNADGSMFGGGDAVNGRGHAGVFAPGTNVMLGGAGIQTFKFGTFVPTNTFTAINGDIVRVPICLFNSSTNNFTGQLRQVYITRDAQTRLVYQNGPTVLGYLISSALNAANDAAILSY